MKRRRLWKLLDGVADAAERLWTSAGEATQWTRATGESLYEAANRKAKARLDGRGPRRPLEWLLGALLFLAAATTAISADDPTANWTVWLPAFFACVAIWIGLFDPDAEYPAGVALFAVLVGSVCTLSRLWVGLRGPLPYEGVRDALRLFACLTTGMAFWVVATRRPRLAFAAWIAALVVAFLARLPLPGGNPLFRPDELPLLLSILWAVVTLGGELARRARPPAGRPRSPALRSWIAGQAHVLAFAAGGGVAWFCLARVDRLAALDGGLAMVGRQSVELLWTKSILFGWGGSALERMAKVFAEPAAATFPGWLGWTGTAAAYGILSFVGAVALALLVARSALRRVRAGARMDEPGQLSLLAAQALLVAIFFGGPNSSVPFALFCVWLGLGCASPPGSSGSVAGLTLWRGALGVPTALAVLSGCIVGFGPTWARSYAAGLTLEDYQDADRAWKLSRRLDLARTLSPWDPKIEEADGIRLREELQRGLAYGWNEPLYRRIVEAYRRAEALDPYDAGVTLQLAKTQRTAERPDDAAETIRRALRANPGAESLMEWLYIYARDRKDERLAVEVADLALRVRPHSPRWWRRRHDLDHDAGRGPEAGSALRVALTADPDDKRLVRASRERYAAMREAEEAGGG